jgi:AcrR family transcriptional regulator
MAALDLFTTQGFEQTTTAQIAAAAGLTQRTFFRHFSDKRDVLFNGQELFAQAFLAGVDAAPAEAAPMQLIAAALASAAALFTNERRPYALMRQTVIDSNQALQERERHKFAGLAGQVADALRARGIPDPAAALAAESGATVFNIAFAQWIRESGQRSLTALTDNVLTQLLSLSVTPYQCDASWTSGAGDR